MRRLHPLHHIQLLPAQFAHLQHRFAIFAYVFSTCTVMVEPKELFCSPAAEEEVCEGEVGDYEAGGVLGRLDGSG
jgi:hypothetical protein